MCHLLLQQQQQKNNDEPRMNLACHCLLWVHINKTKKYNEHQLIVIFSQCTKTKQKKDDNEGWLVVVFFQCTKTKQKKLTLVIVFYS